MFNLIFFLGILLLNLPWIHDEPRGKADDKMEKNRTEPWAQDFHQLLGERLCLKWSRH